MRNERGVSMIEVLIGTVAVGAIFLGLSSLYTATTRALTDSMSQLSLQRQGTLAIEELGRRVRSGCVSGDPASPCFAAAPITVVTCNGRPDSVQVTTPDGTFCFYAGASDTADAGKLCEVKVGAAAGCRDLLYGGLQPRVSPMTLLLQPATPHPSCPQGIPPGDACFTAGAPNPSMADFNFAITDGLTVMSFGISLTCKGRDLRC